MLLCQFKPVQQSHQQALRAYCPKIHTVTVGDKNYNAETVQTIYSSGKSIESIAMAMLYGKGLFKFYFLHHLI